MVLLKNLKMTPVWVMGCLDKLNNLAGVSSPAIEQSLGHLVRWTFHPENPIISIVKKSLLNLLLLPLLKPIPPPAPHYSKNLELSVCKDIQQSQKTTTCEYKLLLLWH